MMNNAGQIWSHKDEELIAQGWFKVRRREVVWMKSEWP